MRRPFRLGLTGSIGMGKSTTAAMFRDEGVPVWDADETVRQLYAKGGDAVKPIGAIFPDAITDGAVDRAALKAHIAADLTALARIEAVVHPLVAANRSAFIERATRDGAALIVLDIPLLFETGADSLVDATLVVSAPPEVQHARVIAREGMTETHLATILGRQMPDGEKRARADYVIETLSIESARSNVRALIKTLKAGHA